VDRGFDSDATDPLGGSGAHAGRRHACEDRGVTRLGDHPAGHEEPVRTRLWSRHALRTLCTAWVAIASSNFSEGPGTGAAHGSAGLEGVGS
jgi:hypothetical protein